MSQEEKIARYAKKAWINSKKRASRAKIVGSKGNRFGKAALTVGTILGTSYVIKRVRNKSKEEKSYSESSVSPIKFSRKNITLSTKNNNNSSFNWYKDTEELKNSWELYTSARKTGDRGKIQESAKQYLDQWTKDAYIPARKKGVFLDISKKIIDDANGNF